MATLVNRQRSIPNGFFYYQPQTNWDSRKMVGNQPSFDRLVQGIIAMRQGNPTLIKKYNWPTDTESVSNEVDAFNAKVCEQMGYNDYIVTSGGQAAPPFPHSPSLFARSGRLVAGARTLIDWLKSGAESVPAGKAAERSGVCAACPMNESGDLLAFFTAPVSEAIREALNQRQGWNLSTPLDDKLGVCSACYCPLKLKVHLPIADIINRMPGEVRAELPAHCWIKKESA